MIIAYASSQPSPVTSQVDKEIDLSAGQLLPQDVQLYAGARDTDDPTATFTFSWHLLKAPEGSSASLSDNQIEQPLLQGVDVWGDYRLFVIAENQVTGERSETDPLKASSGSFTGVHVRSLNAALVKPAAGDRDWFGFAYEWVDTIENLQGVSDDHETRITSLEGLSTSFALDDLSDVTISGTLLEGQVIAYDSTAGEWVNSLLDIPGGVLSIAAGVDTGAVNLDTQSLSIQGTSGQIEVSGGLVGGSSFEVTLGLPSLVNADISGNAGTATSLATARTIEVSGAVSGSASFDGSGDINISTTLASTGINFAASGGASETINLGETINFVAGQDLDLSYYAGVNQMIYSLEPTISSDTTGNAATATSLQNSRLVSLSGEASGSVSFDGTADVSIDTTLAVPTETTRGGVLLEPGTGNSSGAILRREVVSAGEHVLTTYEVNSTTDPNATNHNGISSAVSDSTNIGLRSAALLRNPLSSQVHLDNVSIIIGFGGVTAGSEYAFSLVVYNDAGDVIANNAQATGITLSPTRAADNSPIYATQDYTASYSGPSIPAGGYLGVYITSEPKNIGHSLHFQATFSRAIG